MGNILGCLTHANEGESIIKILERNQIQREIKYINSEITTLEESLRSEIYINRHEDLICILKNQIKSRQDFVLFLEGQINKLEYDKDGFQVI
jgi:hypothetical protein